MTLPVDRQFYSIDTSAINKSHFHTPSDEEKEKLVQYVAESGVGRNKIFSGPYGLRKALYLDYIASGRALSFLEDYIRDEVLPEYGNTHTTTSVTSLQTTLFRHEARDIIRNAVNASEHDSVIFTGSGSTGAIHKLIHALDLTQPPVVFVGPYEHHSNLLPWKETGAKVIRIRQTQKGQVDLAHLELELQAWSGSNRQLIGSFSAASNVTGILADVDAITICLHKHGALALWDYATAAPYVKLDMNPVVPGKDSAFVYKDAMFISPHKFVGGVSTPGVLVAKKRLFRNVVPEKGGGGTVFFVRRDGHRYLREPELREEGGTPAIVGAIRAGLVFQLKTAITPEVIMSHEQKLFRRAYDAWQSVPNLVILGNLDVERLPVFSFLVHHPASGLFLHYNFITALLNDLFGIQARGGCACAGPYAMDLLGLTEEKAAEIENLLAEDGRLDRVHLRRYTEYSHREIIRPGFTRLNLPYFMQEDELEFVLQAVAMVAEHGWKLLPQYMFNPETGEWRQREQQVFKERKWLGHISYASGHMEYAVPKPQAKGSLPESFQDCLDKAQKLFAKAEKIRLKLPDHGQMFDEEARLYQWFLLPSEAGNILSGNIPVTPCSPNKLPFCPPSLRQKLGRQTKMETENMNSRAKEGTTGETSTPDSAVLHESASDTVPKELCTVNVSGGAVLKDQSNCGNEHTSPEHSVSDASPMCEGDCLSSSVCHPFPLNGNRSNKDDFNPLCHTTPSAQLRGGCCVAKRVTDCVKCQMADTSDSLETASHPTSCKSCSQTVCTQKPSHESADFPQAVQYYMERGYACDDPALTYQTHRISPGNVDSAPASAWSSSAEKQSSVTSLPNSESHSWSSGGTVEDSVSASTEFSPVEKQSSPTLLPVSKSQASSETTGDSTSASAEIPSVKKQTLPPASQTESQSLTAESKTESSDKAKKKKKKKTNAAEPKENGEQVVDTQRAEKKKVKKVGDWFPPPKEIFKPAVKAMEEFSMVQDGDRVLVCLSGGKDSLSLLHTMHQYQFYCKSKGISFELGAVTVDPQTPSYDPSPLKEYLATLGVPYFYESQCIMETAVNLPYECASICSFCSRMKRGRIYAAARREGYNVLALGQHLDDLAESFIMSLFHNGSLRTMKAHYTVQEGDLRVVRPFVYVRERDLRHFAEKNKLPVIAENCPACFEAPKERHRTKQLLASQEILFPRLYNSIMTAIRPVMALSRAKTVASDLLATTDSGDDFDI